MKDQDKLLEWYKKQFNTIVEQPPGEVWNNISKELDINEVWTKVDSKLNSIDRRRVLIKRSAYSSLLLLLLFIPGVIILKTFNNKDKVIFADKTDNRFAAGVSSALGNNEINQQTKKTTKHFNHKDNKSISNPVSQNFLVSSFASTRKEPVVRKHNENFTESENSIGNASGPAIGLNINASHNTDKEEFFTVSIPTSLILAPLLDSMAPDFTSFDSGIDSGFDSQKPANNKFHGFYSGGTFSADNIWLLNQLTLDGLKANSLNQTKIDFGYSYGISAGYNFSTHFGGEMNWYINSQSGQTYNFYDEGKYVTKRIRMDISVVNFLLKYRHQAANNWLNTPKSGNILFGLNLCMLKKNRSSLPLNDNDDDIDVFDNIDTYYEHPSYGLVVGYEYELLAAHKIILSSGVIGSLGLNNIYSKNPYIPVSFNRTHAASLSLNLSAKY